MQEWKKDSSRFLGKPKLPNYKKMLAPAYFTYTSFRLKDSYIHFVKDIISPIKTTIQDGKSIKQVRIIPQATCFVVEIVYNKEATDLNLSKDNFLSIDMGVDNLATCVSNVGQPFIANGRVIKSFNRWCNKTNAKLQSFVGDKKDKESASFQELLDRR